MGFDFQHTSNNLYIFKTQWVFGPTTYGKGFSFINSMGPFRPMTYGKGLFVHSMGSYRPTTYGEGLFFINSMGSYRPTTHRRGFIHKTPWVQTDSRPAALPWTLVANFYFKRDTNYFVATFQQQLSTNYRAHPQTLVTNKLLSYSRAVGDSLIGIVVTTLSLALKGQL